MSFSEFWLSLAFVKKTGQKLVSLWQRLTRRARLQQIREILYTEYCNTQIFFLFFASVKTGWLSDHALLL
jgi:hypothetical protein